MCITCVAGTSEAITRFRKKSAKKKAVARRMKHQFSEHEKQDFINAELDLMAELPVGLCDDAPVLSESVCVRQPCDSGADEASQVGQQAVRAAKKFHSLDADGCVHWLCDC